MTGTFYTDFKKRKNSTKQPTGGTSKTFTLKEGTSIEKPVYLLTGNTFTYNYVHAFGHYYFVDDVKSIRNGMIEVSCSMDVLATYKSDIGGYTAFIERSSYSYDDWLADPSVTMVSDVTVTSTVNSALSIFVPGGVYTISVLNTKGSGAGFTSSYITDYVNIEYLSHYVNTNWGSAATDLLDWFQSTFLHTADSIIDCVWTPIALSQIGGTGVAFEQMEIGVDQIPGASGYRITSPFVVSQSLTITIPHVYSDFRKFSPYTMVKLFIPCFGTVDVNPLDFCLSDTIKLQFDVDPCTGDTVCYLSNYSDKLVASYKYNVGVSCPVGKVGSDVTGTISGLLQTAASVVGAAASGPVGAAAGSLQAAASGVNTLATAFAVTPSVSGSKGGRAIAEHGLDVVCTVIARTTKNPADLLSTHGRVLMETKQISSIPGYIKCVDASVPIAGMSSEKDEVNNFLNSGFYYE